MSFDPATELRLEALRLACGRVGDEAAVEVAQRFHNFLTGKSDQSPREVIVEALERAGVT